MMKRYSILFIAATALLSSCGSNTKKANENNHIMSPNNPFAKPSTLPFKTADFSVIKDSDFKPAIEEGIIEQKAEVDSIADNPAAPTFENTFIPLEKSGQLLHRAYSVFNMLSGANTDSVLQKVSEQIAPKLSAANDVIYLNTKLFKKVKAIYSQREQLKLDAESKRLVEYYYQKFILSGANLSDSDKETLKKLNSEDASLEAKYTNQLLAAAKAGAVLISNKTELVGLSDEELAAAAAAAKANKDPGKWLLTLQNTTQQPLLQSLLVRATRQKLLKPHGTVLKKAIPMTHVPPYLAWPRYAPRKPS